MLVTDVGDKMKCDNFKMLVTVLAVLAIININYRFTLASGTYIQKMSPTSKFSHPQIVTDSDRQIQTIVLT